MGKIIVRTMNVGMCNQLFTYGTARYLKEKTGWEIWLDYSHTTREDMKHDAGFASCLGKYELSVDGVIESKDEYNTLTGKQGKNLENIISPPWTNIPFILRRYRNRLRINEIKKKEYQGKLPRRGLGLNHYVGNKSCKKDIENLLSYMKTDGNDLVILSGYWQIPDFVRDIRGELIGEIKERSSVLEEAVKKNSILSNHLEDMKAKDSVCIHVRRGDYVGNADFCTPDYFHEGIRRIKEKLSSPVFYVFSDDIVYAKKMLLKEEGQFVFMEYALRDYEELLFMSSCKHFIISNSSFSWWAQFLSEHRNVIAPGKWFADEEIQLYENDWEIIPIT